MRRRVAIGLTAALAIALMGGVLAISAGGQYGLAQPALAQGGPPVGPGQAPNPRPGMGPMGAGLREMIQQVAGLLGMEPREIMEARRQGRSLADLAAERGVDQARLLEAITGAARTHLDQAVTNGRLTRGQADALDLRVGSRVWLRPSQHASVLAAR